MSPLFYKRIWVMITIFFWIYFIGYIGTFIFVWYALLKIGVYFYQFTRIQCIRGHLACLFWPLFPFSIWLHEISIKKHMSLPFEERMKKEGRVKRIYTDSRGTWEGWGFPEDDKFKNKKDEKSNL